MYAEGPLGSGVEDRKALAAAIADALAAAQEIRQMDERRQLLVSLDPPGRAQNELADIVKDPRGEGLPVHPLGEPGGQQFGSHVAALSRSLAHDGDLAGASRRRREGRGPGRMPRGCWDSPRREESEG